MALIVMMAVVAIAIPTCTMLGCDMSMGQGMPFMPSGTGIYNECSGEWFTSTGPAGIVSNGVESLMLSLVAAAFVAAVVLAPRKVVGVVKRPAPSHLLRPRTPWGKEPASDRSLVTTRMRSRILGDDAYPDFRLRLPPPRGDPHVSTLFLSMFAPRSGHKPALHRHVRSDGRDLRCQGRKKTALGTRSWSRTSPIRRPRSRATCSSASLWVLSVPPSTSTVSGRGSCSPPAPS